MIIWFNLFLDLQHISQYFGIPPVHGGAPVGIFKIVALASDRPVSDLDYFYEYDDNHGLVLHDTNNGGLEPVWIWIN